VTVLSLREFTVVLYRAEHGRYQNCFSTETLLNAQGTKLRQALFALKRIFQDDEDLVLEFVFNQGLNALVQVGRDSNQTYQQYILKALGELAVYVDGMNGLIQCNEIIQWLYQLTESKYRMVTKATLDLLLVFVNYTEQTESSGGSVTPVRGVDSPSRLESPNGLPTNALLFKDAVEIVSEEKGIPPWSYLLAIIDAKSMAESDIQAKALSLINKTLAGFSDQDDFCDMVDALEEQGIEQSMDFHQRKNKNRDLLKEFNIYDETIAQVYKVEYEEVPGTPRRLRRVKSTTPLHQSSSAGSPKRSTSVTGVHQSPALSAMDISLLLCAEQEDLSQESGPPRQRLKVPGSGQSSTASSLASSRRESAVKGRHSRESSADHSTISARNGPVDSQELAYRLAPLASSTPEDKRRGSSPVLRCSSAESLHKRPFQRQNGKCADLLSLT